MATELAKTAFNIRTKLIKEKKPVIMRHVMKEAGYSEEMTRHPGVLVASKGWQECLAQIDYGKHLRQLDEMADTKKNTDKDNVLRSKKMLFDLGDKFPAQKNKIVGLFDKLSEIDDKPGEAPNSN